MIFGKQFARDAVSGRKTAIRRPVRYQATTSGTIAVACRYKPGHTYSIQPGCGKHAIGRLNVTAVQQERVGDLTLADARREGLRTRDDFKAQWVRIHDRAWIAKHKVDLADCLGLSVVSFILCRRFDLEHADTLVWAITFEFARDVDRFMAPLPIPGHSGDYTASAGRSIEPHAPCVDEFTQERYARAADTYAEHQRASFLVALEAQRVKRKAERRPWSQAA